MTSTTPILALLCGKSDAHLQAVTEILKPEVEALKWSKTIEDAISFLTSSGSMAPPQVIAMGGGYSNEEFERLASCTPGIGEQVVWFRPAEFKATSTAKTTTAAPVPSGPPPPEEVARRYRKAFDDWFAEGGKEGKGKGQVRYL